MGEKKRRIPGPLQSIQRLTVLKSLQWTISAGMRRAGYQWEERRTGELKIGIWRKSWSNKKSGRRRLVVLPGFGDTPLSWLMVLGLSRSSVRARFDELVLVEFPGFSGFLSEERAFHSIDLLTGTLFDLLDSLSPTCLLGHSLGGWLASLYAVECGLKQRPRTPSAAGYSGPSQLILVDTSGLFSDEQESRALQAKFREAMDAKEGGLGKMRQYAFAHEPFWLKWIGTQVSGFFSSEEIAQFVESFQARHLLDEEKISRIAAQVWLIWGELDTLIPPANLPLWLKKLGATGRPCRAVLIKNSGHSPHIETPAALAVVLSQIFKDKQALLELPVARRWWKCVEPE